MNELAESDREIDVEVHTHTHVYIYIYIYIKIIIFLVTDYVFYNNFIDFVFCLSPTIKHKLLKNHFS